MFTSFRVRLTFSILAVLLAVMVFLSLFLINLLRNYYLTYQEEIMVRAGKLAADLFAGYLQEAGDPVLLSGLAENFSRQVGARVIIVDRNMLVIADSVRVEGRLGTLLDREEVQAALRGETGRSIQFSDRSQQWVMQVAVPVEAEDTVQGAVFLSFSLRGVYRVLGEVSRYFLIATIVAMTLATALGVIMAHRFTRPVEQLTLAAQEMARGNLDQKIQVSSRDEIGRLAEQFNNMAARLNQMTQHLRSFVGNVSHELRTPLASVSLLVKSLRDYPVPPEQQREFLNDIDHETERLANLVEDLLELTRLEREESGIQKEKVDLKELLVEVGGKVAPRIERQQQVLKLDIPDELPIAWSSADHLKQVLYNILDNAIKYTPPGGIIQIGARETDREIEVKVSDTGRGVPFSALPHVFERFYRVDKGRSRELGGTGLGLAICKEITEALGGRIWAESIEGVGSTFYFTVEKINLN